MVDYLSDLLAVRVGTKVPSPMPDEFVRVNVTGGGRPNLIEVRPTVLFECWAASSATASLLARNCWMHVNAVDHAWVSPDVWCDECDPSTPTNNPDPNYETRDRYQFYASMTITLEDAS